MKEDVIILSSGSELTQGKSVDTNSGWIAQELSPMGFQIRRFVVLPDDPLEILETLKSIQMEYQTKGKQVLIIMTGGLGPTADDYTLQVVCDWTDSKPVIFEKARIRLQSIYERRGKSYSEILPMAMRQTNFPDKATPLDNKTGIAPGFYLKLNDFVSIACFPGVPSEMKPMFDKEFRKILKNNYELGSYLFFEKYIWNIGESLFQEKFIKAHESQFSSELIWGVTAKKGYIRILFYSKSSTELQNIESLLTREFSDTITNELIQSIPEKLKSLNKTISVAESCTGGLLSKMLTDMSGSSSYFKGGFIVYDNTWKIQELGVNPDTINSYGAVSEETAKEMIAGLLKKTNTDLGVSITGIAGPTGGSEDKPVGTVFVGMGDKKGNLEITKYFFPGNRDSIRESTANNCFYKIHSFLEKYA